MNRIIKKIIRNIFGYREYLNLRSETRYPISGFIRIAGESFNINDLSVNGFSIQYNGQLKSLFKIGSIVWFYMKTEGDGVKVGRAQVRWSNSKIGFKILEVGATTTMFDQLRDQSKIFGQWRQQELRYRM